MILRSLKCACGSSDLAAICPGHDAVYEHPRDMFGLPDLRQKPVVSTPEVPDVGRCLKCLREAFPALNKLELSHYG